MTDIERKFVGLTPDEQLADTTRRMQAKPVLEDVFAPWKAWPEWMLISPDYDMQKAVLCARVWQEALSNAETTWHDYTEAFESGAMHEQQHTEAERTRADAAEARVARLTGALWIGIMHATGDLTAITPAQWVLFAHEALSDESSAFTAAQRAETLAKAAAKPGLEEALRAGDAVARDALADVRDGCDRKTRRCVVCWYGPECGPFYGVQRVTIDEERPCPCACHRAEVPVNATITQGEAETQRDRLVAALRTIEQMTMVHSSALALEVGRVARAALAEASVTYETTTSATVRLNPAKLGNRNDAPPALTAEQAALADVPEGEDA